MCKLHKLDDARSPALILIHILLPRMTWKFHRCSTFEISNEIDDGKFATISEGVGSEIHGSRRLRATKAILSVIT